MKEFQHKEEKEQALPLSSDSKYFFLYLYGVSIAGYIHPFFVKYTALQKGIKGFQKFAVYFCKSFLLTPTANATYFLFFIISTAWSISVSRNLAQTLLDWSTGKGGEFLFTHFWEFYNLLYPLLVFFSITPLLWLAISFTLIPGLLESKEKRLEEYLMLESSVQKMGQGLFISIILLYLLLCVLLIYLTFVTLEDLSLAVSGLDEGRFSVVQPLVNVTGVDLIEGDDPRSVLKRVQEAVEKLVRERNQLPATSSGDEPSGDE
jgi:hypothetical protein